jgi:hypothetical protein
MHKPATIKTVQVVFVAIAANYFGMRMAEFSGSGKDWAAVIIFGLAVILTSTSLIMGFWKPNA